MKGDDAAENYHMTTIPFSITKHFIVSQLIFLVLLNQILVLRLPHLNNMVFKRRQLLSAKSSNKPIACCLCQHRGAFSSWARYLSLLNKANMFCRRQGRIVIPLLWASLADLMKMSTWGVRGQTGAWEVSFSFILPLLIVCNLQW